MKLKKCPFCNSEASVWAMVEGYVVECNNENCGCTYGNTMLLDFEEVIEKWNERGVKNN